MEAPPYVRRLVGQQFRLLRVTEEFERLRQPSGKIAYKVWCECSCGNKKLVYANALTQGRTGSCGCDKSRYRKNEGARNYHFSGFREIRGSLWSAFKRGAQDRGLPFELTIEEAWELFEQQGRKCALSGVPIQFGVYARRVETTTASLDRIDNTEGYTRANVQWVHKQVNVMRNKLEVDDFVNWCRLIVVHSERSS